MRYEKYIGDTSIELEGEPEEIIQVLKYLDDNYKGIIIKDNEGDTILYGDEDGSLTLNAYEIKKAPVNEDVELIIKINEDEIARTVVDIINKKSKCDYKGVNI